DALAVLEREIESAKQSAPAEFHAEVPQLNHAIAKLRRRRNAEFNFLLDLRAVLRGGFVVTLESVLLFAALRARALSDPGQLALQKHLPFVFDARVDRKSTRLNSSHRTISYAVFCLKKKIH